MSVIAAMLLVFLAAATPWLEVLIVVPAAVLAGLPVIPTVVVATLGNVATLIPVVLAGERIRARLQRRRSRRIIGEPKGDNDGTEAGEAADDHSAAAISGRSQRGQRLFERYGLPGLALLGPLVTGIHVAGIAAISAGADRRASLYWLSAGVALWSVIAAVATVIGLESLVDPESLPDLFGTRSS